MVKRHSHSEKKSLHRAVSYSRENQPKTHIEISVNKKQTGEKKSASSAARLAVIIRH